MQGALRHAQPAAASAAPATGPTGSEAPAHLVQEALHLVLVGAVLVGGDDGARAEAAQPRDQQQLLLGADGVAVAGRLAHLRGFGAGGVGAFKGGLAATWQRRPAP
jgi:hypothetical protein